MSSSSCLLSAVRSCTLCVRHLPHGPRPVLQMHPSAKILIVGQAPGRKVHESGVPFDDASGERLRAWLGLARAVFYDPRQVALLPMGFCYPGTGTGGDLPPRAECASTWRAPLLATLQELQLTVVLGSYAQAYHFGTGNVPVTERVRGWRSHWPRLVPLPHPSPRNNRWLRRNPWMESEVLPPVRRRIARLLAA